MKDNPHDVLEFAMAAYILSIFGQENKLAKALYGINNFIKNKINYGYVLMKQFWTCQKIDTMRQFINCVCNSIFICIELCYFTSYFATRGFSQLTMSNKIVFVILKFCTSSSYLINKILKNQFVNLGCTLVPQIN